MGIAKRLLIIALLFMFMPRLAVAQAPPNDLCQNATYLGSLSLSQQVCQAGTTVGAGPEFPYAFQDGCYPTGNTPSVAGDVWYTFTTAGGSNQLLITLTGTMATLNVALYSGTCGSLSGLGCETSTTGSASHTFGQILANTTYYIQVSGGSIADSGTFNLCLNSSNNPNACINQGYMTITPEPANGTFSPGQTVTFCYTVTSYTQLASNWFHGVEIIAGAGWNPASFQSISAATSCDGAGNWAYYPNGETSSATGQYWGPGYYYDSDLGGPLDGNPGNNYGDDCTTHNWTFCWSYTVDTSSAGCANISHDLSMQAIPSSDGMSGSWTSLQCTGDPSIIQNLTLTCCPAPHDTSYNPTCPGACNGSAIALGQGIPPFTYAWSNGDTGDSISGLCAGLYTVTATDSTGCIAATSVVVNNPGTVTFTIDTVGISCNGSSNGKAWVAVTGGAGGAYTYLWNTVPAQTTDTITGLSAGTYQVIVTQPGGCNDTFSVTLNDPLVLTLTKDSVALRCNGNSSGSASVIASGGTPGYTYRWSNGQTNASLSGLAANTYYVTVTDSHNCTVIDTITVTQPQALTISVAGDSILCNANNTGIAWVVATGGQQPYNYVWNTSPAQSTDTAVNLTAGSYSVTTTDNNGCPATGTLYIGQPTALNLSVTHTNDSCSTNNGTATAIVTGGTPPYTYSWNSNPVQNTDTAIHLAAGTYTVTVQDAHGCTASDTVTITARYANLNLGPDTTLCTGDNLTLDAGPGLTTYAWSTTATTETITVNTTGTYSVTVTLTGTCPAVGSINVTFNNPIANLGPDVSLCPGIPDTLNPGSQPGGTTFLWDNGTTDSIRIVDTAGTYWVQVTYASGCNASDTVNVNYYPAPVINLHDTAICINNSFTFDAGQFVSFLWSTGATTETITVGTAGEYIVTVTDFNGCSGVDSARLTVDRTTINLGPDTTLCAGLSFTLDPGPGFNTYYWSTGQTTESITVATTNDYSVTVTASSGCPGVDTILVTFDPQPVVNLGPNVTLCPGVCDTLNAGTQPVGSTYLWDDGTTNQTRIVCNQSNYWVTVSNAGGCFTSDTINVNYYAPPIVNLGPDTTICAGNGVSFDAGPGFTSYNWSNGSTVEFINVSLPGKYIVTVTDGHGCIGMDSVVLANYIVVVPLADSFTVCRADSITLDAGAGFATYEWDNDSAQNTEFLKVTAGSYFVSVTDQHGCTGIANTTVFPLDSTIPTLSGDSICPGISFTLSPSGRYASYVWSDGSRFSTLTVDTPGNYSVTVTDFNGCTASASAVVNERAAPAFTLTASPPLCPNNTDTLIGPEGPTGYLWSNGTTTQNTVVSSPGTYGLTVTNGTGCTASAIDTVLDGSFTLNVTADTTPINKGDSTGLVTVTGTQGNYTYLWSPGSSLNDSTSADPIAKPTTSTLYSVTVTDTSTHCAVTDTVTVGVDSVAVFNFADAFTPNGDQHNDSFGIISVGSVLVKDFLIVNRWGETVHSTPDPWDGKWGGKDQPAGTYVYEVTVMYTDTNNVQHTVKYKGAVTLLR